MHQISSVIVRPECKLTGTPRLPVQVSLPESEVRAGLALQPQSLDVSLVDRPLTDLLFTQFMASVSGKVFYLGNKPFIHEVDGNAATGFAFSAKLSLCPSLLTSSVLRGPVGEPAAGQSPGREEDSGAAGRRRRTQLLLRQRSSWEIQRFASLHWKRHTELRSVRGLMVATRRRKLLCGH